MTTLPGILTAIAGVLSAGGTAAGIYFAHQGGDSAPSPAPQSLNITVQGSAAPSGPGQVNTSNLSTASTDSSVDPQIQSQIDSCANGDEDACTTLLDELAQECDAGYGLSCDVLYEVSAAGSDYETYGATCGGRYEDEQYADECSQL